MGPGFNWRKIRHSRPVVTSVGGSWRKIAITLIDREITPAPTRVRASAWAFEMRPLAF